MNIEKKPIKAKNLKVVDYKGTYYATFDGSRMWKIEKWIFKLIMMCNGEKTFDQIADEISKLSEFPVEDIKIGLKPIFEDLEKEGFIIMN
jgi:hypothetical protein